MDFRGPDPTHSAPHHLEYHALIDWDSFQSEAKMWDPRALFVSDVQVPLWRERLREAESEDDIVCYIRETVLGAITEMTNIQFFGRKGTKIQKTSRGETSRGETSRGETSGRSWTDVLAKAIGTAIAVLEFKKDITSKSGRELLYWAREHEKTDVVRPGDKYHDAAVGVLQQLNFYLASLWPHSTSYGIICTLNDFWFVRRVPGTGNGTLQVSTSVPYQSRDPTLLRAMGYLLSLGLQELHCHPLVLMKCVPAFVQNEGDADEVASNSPSTLKRPRAHLVSETPKLAFFFTLGAGRSGNVVLASSSVGPVAVKFVPFGSSLVEELQHEVQMYNALIHLQGDVLPRLYHAGPVFDRTFYGLCLELVGRNLSELLRIGEDIRKLRAPALHAIDQLHASKIVHRDIRLENICVQAGTGRVCLIDLAFSGKGSAKEIIEERRAFAALFA